VAVIFCDLSTSVDSLSIKKVAQDAGKLLLKFPPESKLYYLPIDETPYIKPIMIYDKPRKPKTTSEKEGYLIITKRKAQQVHNNIIMLYRNVYASAEFRNRPLSCIIRTLDTANSIFSQYRSTNKSFTYELIYLSDMLEECNNSPIGPLYMHKKNYLDVKRKISTYNPGFDLSFVNLSVIVSIEQYAMSSAYVNSEELKGLWRNIFMRAGFTNEQLRTFNFLSMFPHRLESLSKDF
jgi:hypothetical protein